MKVNKTLSLDYELVRELRSHRNQSAFVNDAIRRKMGANQSIDSSIPTTMIMGVLMNRADCDPFVKRCLKTALISSREASQSQQI